MEDRSKWLLNAIKGAVLAGKAILEVYDAPDGITVEKKSDNSPLTLADRRAHQIIKGAIEEFGIPILSEEGREIPFAKRKKWQMMWIVDPLDGTKEFIKRNGEFTVNIALCEGNVPTLGVIFVPVADSLYFADANLGAFTIETCRDAGIDCDQVGNIDSVDHLIQKAHRLPMHRQQDRPFTIMGSRSHATPELERYVEEMRKVHGKVDFISAGSSLKICKVAEGRADVYPRLGPTMEWDTAAGQAIAVTSGAQVVRHDNEMPLTYNKEDLLNPWFIVKRS